VARRLMTAAPHRFATSLPAVPTTADAKLVARDEQSGEDHLQRLTQCLAESSRYGANDSSALYAATTEGPCADWTLPARRANGGAAAWPSGYAAHPLPRRSPLICSHPRDTIGNVRDSGVPVRLFASSNPPSIRVQARKPS
jgi:hypothetical protein